MEPRPSHNPQEDILCKVQKLENFPDTLNVHKIEVLGDLAYLTIIVPETLLCHFRSFLGAAISISHYVQTQTRVKRVLQKSQSIEYQADLQRDFAKFSARVVARFDSFITAGSTIREAIRQARDSFKGERDMNLYTVELIVRQAGRLSKSKRGK